MFTLLIDRNHRVLLTRFSGTLRHDELLDQANAAREIATREGKMRAVYDFSDVDKVDIAIPVIKQAAKQPQNIPTRSACTSYRGIRCILAWPGSSGPTRLLAVTSNP